MRHYTAALLHAMHRAAPGAAPDARALSGGSDWSLVVGGTYGHTLCVMAVRERDDGYDTSAGSEAGAYTRPLVSSTMTVSDIEHTL